MRLVFMGTPDFAAASLEALLRSDDSVVGIVTQPDRPKGRGQILTPSPVKLLAQREQIPLLQPLKMKDPEFLQRSGWVEAGPDCGRGVRAHLASGDPLASPTRLYQCAWLPSSKISRRCSDPVGHHQRRNRNRNYDHAHG